jgi:hypothetical protein
MSLGPAGDEPQAAPADLEVGAEDLWTEEQPAIVAPVEVPEEPEEDPRLVQIQRIVEDVVDFLKGHDPHRVWRKHLTNHVHRYIGYSGWDKRLRVEFDRRFQGFLCDPQFITATCQKVLNMELGRAIGAQWVATTVVMAAGWTAFVMSGLDN